MTDAILIFTFGPVQSFIAEARRASDLYAGSHILVLLAQAAADVIGPEQLIYPTLDNRGLPADMPNKIVAQVPWDQAESLAQAAGRALRSRWQDLAQPACDFLAKNGPLPDQQWQAIWNRQIDHYWEVHWAAAELSAREAYRETYDQASKALDAAKRVRAFTQAEEGGRKDSLSGKRSALHVAGMDGRTYWSAVSRSPRVMAARLRPEGKERLDAIGAVKRFGEEAEKFPSVSSIAAADFLEKARTTPQLAVYRQAMAHLGVHEVNGDDDWPYDGDLLFHATLEPERLRDSYGLGGDETVLQAARQALSDLYQSVGMIPRPYYALILLDGDNMGQHVSNCHTAADHQELSRRLSRFAKRVDGITGKYRSTRVYAGGDDVFALAPLSTAIPLARDLADAFQREVGSSASAGIAIAHHLYPLDVVLRAAHEAERHAKSVPGKNAVGVRVIKRGGEILSVRSRWDDPGTLFDNLITWFASGALSSRLAYDAAPPLRLLVLLPHLADPASDLTPRPPSLRGKGERGVGWETNRQSTVVVLEAGDMIKAELRRLVKRHLAADKVGPDPAELAAQLTTWAGTLPEKGMGLADWLLLARFIAQGGQE